MASHLAEKAADFESRYAMEDVCAKREEDGSDAWTGFGEELEEKVECAADVVAQFHLVTLPQDPADNQKAKEEVRTAATSAGDSIGRVLDDMMADLISGRQQSSRAREKASRVSPAEWTGGNGCKPAPGALSGAEYRRNACYVAAIRGFENEVTAFRDRCSLGPWPCASAPSLDQIYRVCDDSDGCIIGRWRAARAIDALTAEEQLALAADINTGYGSQVSSCIRDLCRRERSALGSEASCG
jgi:hypothetical protein